LSVDANRVSEPRALGKLFDGDRVRECENRIDCPLRVDIPSEQP